MQEEAMLNLRWDFFSSHLASTLDFCYEKQHFVDLSLVCKNNVTFKCHKMILSATSGFFRRLLTNNEHPHPLIILHDIDPEDLKAVLNFMYYGEIEVPESNVKNLVKVARVLDIAGLKDLQPSGQFSDRSATSGQFSDSSATRLGNSLPEIEEEIEVKKEPVSLEENGKPKIPLIKLQKPQVQKNCYNLRQRTGSLVRDSDFVVDSYKKNKRKKIVPEEKVISKPNQLGFKNGVKKVDDCNYFKKLKMLDEVEIIFQPQEVQGYDTGNSVFIKDEVDIDESQKRDKISLGPGVEIFKTFPWKPGTSRDF